MENHVIILLIVGAAIALVVAFWLICIAFVGAVALFVAAAEQGFVGVAIYIACWVFLFPAMLILCVVIGLFAALTKETTA